MPLALGLGLGLSFHNNSGNGPSLDLDFLTLSALPASVTFTRASTATYFDSAGVLQTASSGVPRLADYNPSTLTRMGFLVEGSRTNLLLRSAEFDNASWQKNPGLPVTATANQATGPDGATSADLITTTAGAGYPYLRQAVTGVDGTTYTYSVFVKYTNSDYIWFDFPTDSFLTTFRFSTATFTYVAAGITTSVVACQNGWYRIQLSRALNGTTSMFAGIGIADAAGNHTWTPAGTETVLVWGAQLEAATFPSSYIPTTSATVPRSADLAVITGAAAAAIINNTEGTLFAEFAFAGGDSSFGSSARGILEMTDGTSAEWHATYNRAGAVGWISNDGGVPQSGENVGATIAVGAATRIAYGYKLNDTRLAREGSLTSLDPACTMPTCDRVQLGNLVSNGWLYGHLRRVKVYRFRHTDAQLQALTV